MIFFVKILGDFGKPIFKRKPVVAVLIGTLISLSNFICAQYACSRLSQTPTPPSHAFNRGYKKLWAVYTLSKPKLQLLFLFLATAVNGICLILQGYFGVAGGIVPYPQNIALLAVSRVSFSSPCFDVYVCDVWMMVAGEQSVCDYFNLCPCHALWYLPESSCLRISHSFPRAGRPVHGVKLWVSGVLEAPAQLDAIFFSSHLAALFLASGLSFIQYFEINSPRNLVVLGVSIFFGFQTTDIVSNKMDELTSK